MNAGRKYERSMIYHTKGAVDFGCTFEEIVEYLLVAYAYAGSEALPRIALALRYAQSLKGNIGDCQNVLRKRNTLKRSNIG